MRALESTFSKRDSALGEQCGSVAKIVKGTNAKFANLPQFSQSSHSPTAIPRIYEKESRASLRADNGGEAIHKDTRQKVDSSMDCHALPCGKSRNDRKMADTNTSTARNDKTAVDCFTALLMTAPFFLSLRESEATEAIHKNIKTQKVDSRFFTQTAQPAHHDSRNCGVASGAFCGFWGRARLEICGYPKIHKIAAMDTQSRILENHQRRP